MKHLILTLAIIPIVFMGCSSKQITWDAYGNRTITTKTSEDTYHEQQAAAWAGYFEALKNPPVIATIQQTDGTILTINSQIPPPVPTIRQHKNQIIGPMADMVKWGIGGTVAYGITRGIIRGSGDVNVANSGDGTVITDRSDNIASKSNTELSTDTDRSTVDSSDNSDRSDRSTVDNTDNSVIDSHDQTATPTVVEQPVQVIEKDVVIVGQEGAE
jgi:hypothetical protein